MSFRSRRLTNVAALMGGTAASTLLGGETDGLAIDFTDASLTVRDTTTTSNAWGQIEGNAQEFWRSRSFTSYSSPSPKITRDSDGTYTYRPHNLCYMSENVESAAWIKTATTTTGGQSDPNGGTAASLVAETATTNSHFINLRATEGLSVTASVPLTASIYVKDGTRRYVQLAFDDGTNGPHATYDLQAGTVTETGAHGTGTYLNSTITAVGGSWYRITLTGIAGTGSSDRFLVLASNSATPGFAPSYLGSTSNNFYVFGAQLNAGQSALTYVKTAAHNLVLQSQTFATTWSVAEGLGAVSEGSTVAPDGTATADTLTEDTGTSTHRISSGTVTVESGATYTASVHVKAGTNDKFWFTLYGGASGHVVATVFDLGNDAQTTASETQVGGTSGTLVSTLKTKLGNGWYRLSVTYAISRTAVQLQFGHANVATGNNLTTTFGTYDAYLGSSRTLFVWGAQLELASSPGKYVTTTTAAVYSANYDLPREWGAANSVTNLCIRSQELANAAWTATSLTVTDNTVANPLGGATTAATVALVDASANHNIASTSISFTSGTTYTASVYVKYNTHAFFQVTLGSGPFGTGVYANFDVQNGTLGTVGGSASATITSVGSGWYRLTVTGTAGATSSATLQLLLVSGLTAARSETWDPNSTNSLYAYGAQVEAASSAGTYIHTTATARTDYFHPTDLSCQGLLCEEARTNICLYARDLTQSNWTKTSATAALTATGVDGGANRASTLTASAANGTAVQNITSASAARSVSMFVKRRTGTGTVTISHSATTGSEKTTNGTFDADTDWTKGTGWAIAGGDADATAVAAAAYLKQNVTVTEGKLYKITFTITAQTSGAVSWYTLDAGNAVVNTGTARSTAATFSEVFRMGASVTQIAFARNGSDWTGSLDTVTLLEVAETDITSSINSSTWTRVSITNETITNPAVCIKLATSGDAIDIDYVQSEAGAFITSPIYTSSASVTRAQDIPTLSVVGCFAWSNANGTLYAKSAPLYAAGAQQDILRVNDGTSNEVQRVWNSSGSIVFNTIDGGVTQSTIVPAGSEVNGTARKAAASFALNDMAASYNGGAVGTDTSGTMPTVHTLTIGGVSSASGNRHMQQVMVLPRTMSDAELIAVST